MPKVGMEPLRRRALIDATISAIGERGSLDVTMSEIAGRAGVSSALAHHYFGAKDELLQATMRHLLAELNADTRQALATARVEAAHKIQELVYDQAAFIPMYKVPYTREAFWRWVKLPESYGTRITEALFEPMGGEYLRTDGLLWIDEEAKAETLKALAEGRTTGRTRSA